ncbi:MAG: hypothetical protein IT270_07835 [Saprospiraceae bacterium]|nr:hypothetical protein [Saprospiraceae bacterium]
MPISMEFDSNGYLLPYERLVPTNLETFKKWFVEHNQSENRNLLFSNFLVFVSQLFEKTQTETLKIWINGSFTNIDAEPNDIDFVFFVSMELADEYELLLETAFNNESLFKNLMLDGYFVIEYPEMHVKRNFTESDCAYWLDFFTKTRPSSRGKKYKKGLIEITIFKHEIDKI